MLQSKMVGYELDRTSVQVSIQIPTVLYNSVISACKRLGLEEEVYSNVFRHMATQGFEKTIQERLGEAVKMFTPAPAGEPAPNQALEMGQVKEQLQQMGQLVEMVNQLRGAMSTLNGGLTDVNKLSNPLTTDCPKPVVPARKMDSSKDS